MLRFIPCGLGPGLLIQLIGTDKSGGYINPLGCECIANRDFHLFLCGDEFTFKLGDIIKTSALRNEVFNCIQDNDPEKDSFHWVGKIDKNGITKMYNELRGLFS